MKSLDRRFVRAGLFWVGIGLICAGRAILLWSGFLLILLLFFWDGGVFLTNWRKKKKEQTLNQSK